MPRKIRSKVERNVHKIDEDATTLDAAILMTEKYVGSVIVSSSSEVRGIFTERDLMMKVVGEKKDPAKVKLKDAMSYDIARITPDDTWSHCLNLMKERRCRHLLVYENDEFYGILSLRDLITMLKEEKDELITQLEKYITGSY